MAKPIFTWYADLNAQRSVKPNVHKTSFGDGYEQRIAVGINNKPKKWNVRFTRDTSEANAILSFLETRGGLEAFTWTDPNNVTSDYVCREWSSNQKMFGVYEVAAVFEQVFEA